MNEHSPQPPQVYTVDWDQVKTLQDLVKVLSALGLEISIYESMAPQQYKELIETGYLIKKI